MRRLLAVTVAVVAFACASTAVAAPLFVVNGRGWGHGIGMSQYGAYGFAQRGWTHARILAHYYRGTRLGVAPRRQVRVLLAAERSSLSVTAASVSDASGTYPLAPRTQTVGRDLVVRTASGVRTLASPAHFAGDVKVGDRAYRGSLVLYSSGGSLTAVNHAGLEEYLYGVVPWEMPASWHPEALKAQAVAARSYALASLRGGGTFDVYADVRSQVYGGVAAEDARTTAAIDATAGRIVVYGGAVAHTFFHSTSGGRTASIQHVWPGAQPLPYLVSVGDPYDSLSPYHRWGPLAFTAPQVASRLGASAPARLADLGVTRNGSGRAATVTARGAGATSEISAAAFQAALGLRSTWFSVGVLSLDASRTRIVYGDRVVLSGIARGLGRVSLEQKPFGAGWQRAAVVVPGEGARFRGTFRPRVTTVYRLGWRSAKGIPRRVFVAARVSFSPYRGGNALAGVVRPAVAGGKVEIQRRTATGTWRTIAGTSTDAAGRFRVGVRVVPGTYRARARVGGGLVPGTTPTLTVVRG